MPKSPGKPSSSDAPGSQRKKSKSNFSGVRRQTVKEGEVFIARIIINGREQNLGSFSDAQEAARAYDAAAFKQHLKKGLPGLPKTMNFPKEYEDKVEHQDGDASAASAASAAAAAAATAAAEAAAATGTTATATRNTPSRPKPLPENALKANRLLSGS